MKSIQAFVTCFLLLSTAVIVSAQKSSRQSQVMKEFGPLIAKEARAEKKRAQKAAAQKRAAKTTQLDLSVETLNNDLSIQGSLPAVEWPRPLAPVPLESLLGSGSSKNKNNSTKAPVIAQAATRQQPVVRGVKNDRRVIVRTDPRSWYRGSINEDDRFLLKGVGGPKDRWAFGDVIGNPKLKNVWVLREGLKPGPVPTREAPAARNRQESRANLDRFASWISPGRTDGVKTKLLNETPMFGNYNPRTDRFYDALNQNHTLRPGNPREEYRVRWITQDGNAAIIRRYHVDRFGQEIKNTSQWGIVPCATLAIAPCRH